MNQAATATFKLPFVVDAAKILLGACAAGVTASAALSLAVLALVQ
jgi:hypothetical protein